MQAFPSTGKNNDYIFSDHEGIAIGCGDKYGVFIKNELVDGFSTSCATFDNIILSNESDFDIQNIEIWGLEI